MVNYQLTGTDSFSATFANLAKLAVAPVIEDGGNVINVEMKIAKFWIDRTFAILFADGTNSIDSKCTRTNILDQLTITDPKYKDAKHTLIGNSVGHLLGLTVPVDNALRLKELVDIMTPASQTANEASVAKVATLAIDTFVRKVIGDDDPTLQVPTNTEKAHQVEAANDLVTECLTSAAKRTTFDTALFKHVVHYLDSTFTGAQDANGSVFTKPTTAAAGTSYDASGTNNVDSIIGALIQQAASFNPSRLNKLLGASAEGGADGTADDPVPDLHDGVKAFHFLRFEVDDVLTFKNTVTVGSPISTANGGGQGASGTDPVGTLIVNFNLTVAENTDTDLANHLVLGSTLGTTFTA